MEIARLLAVAFALSAILFATAGTITPIAVAPALFFTGLACLFWHHDAVEVRERAERRRADDRQASAAGGTTSTDTGRNRAGSATSEMAPAEARDVLGLEPGTAPEDVEQAYRERVKEVHPDQGGDEEAFKRVRKAYERLDAGEP